MGAFRSSLIRQILVSHGDRGDRYRCGAGIRTTGTSFSINLPTRIYRSTQKIFITSSGAAVVITVLPAWWPEATLPFTFVIQPAQVLKEN